MGTRKPSAGTLTDACHTRAALAAALTSLTLLALGAAPAFAAPPANDAFASPEVLTGASASTTGTNDEATKEAGEPNHAGEWSGQHSVWYRWEAPRDGTVVLDTAGSEFDTALAAYTGTSLDALTERAAASRGEDHTTRIRFAVTAGETYRIALDGANGASGELSVHLTLYDTPANDAFASAQPLTGTHDSASAETAGATFESPAEPNDFPGPTVWYSWTAPSSGVAVVDTAGSHYDTHLGVFVGDRITPLGVVTENDDDSIRGDGTSRVAFRAQAGTTYKIQVGGGDHGVLGGSLKLELSLGQPPGNDTFAAALDLGHAAHASVSGDDERAFSETGEPIALPRYDCDSGNAGTIARTVWYRWTAPSDGSLTIRTIARFQTVLAAYTGPTVMQLARIANQPQDYDGGSEQIRIRVAAGTTYAIQVDTHCAEVGGDFDLALNLTPSPPNDDLVAAAPLVGLAADVDATNVGATQEACEPAHGGNAYDPSVWYSWTAPVTGDVQLAVTGLDGVIGVYTGASTCSLTTVPSTRVADARDRRFRALAGTRYLIAVDGAAARQAPFHLALREHVPPANDDFAHALDLGGATTASASGTNGGAWVEQGEPSQIGYCAAGPFARSVWYSWTAPSGGSLQIEATAAFASVLSVYTGDALGSLQRVASEPQVYEGGTGHTRVRVEAGVTYRLAVASQCAGDDGQFDLKLALGDRPANDDLAGATLLTGAHPEVDGTNVAATPEDCEPGGGGWDASVWYAWTAPDTGSVTVTTSGALDAVAGVHTGATTCQLSWVSTTPLAPHVQRFKAVAGTTYRISVEGAAGAQGSFHLALDAAPTPANDAFASATDLGSGATASVQGTNKGASAENGEPSDRWLYNCDDYEASTVWYRWTAPRSSSASVRTTGDAEREVAVYTGSELSGLTRVQLEAHEGTWFDQARFRAAAGTTYYVAIDSRCKYVEGDFGLSLDLVDRPTNDDFANAEQLSGASPEADGTNLGATGEQGEPSHGGSFPATSVWYRWTPPATGGATFELSGDLEGLVTVYSGDSIDKLTRLTGTQPGPPGTQHVHATAGTTYWIAVDGIQGKQSAFHLAVRSGARPANDDFAAAQELTGAHALVTGSVTGATAEAGEPGWDGFGGASVWFDWTAPDDGRATLMLPDYDFFGRTAVYTGDQLDALTGVDGGPGVFFDLSSFRAHKGTTYHVAVDAYIWYRGGFSLALDLTPPPPNDDFANAAELSGSSDSATGATDGATTEPGESRTPAAGARASTWYRWTAPADGRASVDLAGSGFDAVVAAYTGSQVDALTQIGHAESSTGLRRARLEFQARAGETYAIAVDGSQPRDVGTVKLALEETPIPANDDFTGAERLRGSVASASGTTVGASHEAAEPKERCCARKEDASVWYRWRAPASGEVTVDTANSDFDTTLKVGTGGALASIDEIAANDDADGTVQSRVSFRARGGTDYWMRVDGQRSGTPPHGGVHLALRQSPAPPNDAFADAGQLTGNSAEVTATTAGATGESGEPQHAARAGGASVWYAWTAAADGPVTISTAGSYFDTLLAVYTGNDLGALTPVAADDDAPGARTSELTFDASAGTTYRIAVDGAADADGPVAGELHLALDWTAPKPPPPPPPPPAPLTLSVAVQARKLPAVLAHGLPATARCSRACSLSATMLVGGAAAGRLWPAPAPVHVATASGTGSAKGPTALLLRLPRATVAKLAGARKLVTTVRVTAHSGRAAKTVVRYLTVKR